MNWTVWILFCLCNVSTGQEKTIRINLVPRDYVDPREDDQFICGFVETLDPNRFLAEQNSDFIFQSIDNRKDPSPDYKTKVFDVAKLSDSGEVRKLEPDLYSEYGEGLFTLLMAPPTAECNQDTFENAKDDKGFYPVYIGNKDGITNALDKYKTQGNTFKPFYKNIHPKLCGTFTLMDHRAAKSRAEGLASIFSFLFDKDVSRSIKIDEDLECRGSIETEKALKKSELFETSMTPSFKEPMEEVFEFERVFHATLTRASSSKAAVAILKPILDGSATSDDIDPTESFVVFKPSATEVDIFVTIREDGVSEDDENFNLEISNFAKTRMKRAVPDKIEAVPHKIEVKIIDNFGRKGFFARKREHLEARLCAQRFNAHRMTSKESNTIIELVLSQEQIKVETSSWMYGKQIKHKFSTINNPVNFLEEYDAKKHKQVKQDDKMKAYYFPYYVGTPGQNVETGEKDLNVGWVDIPKKPKKDQPRYAVTGHMNGCAVVVMTKTDDDKNLRVYHLQSPGPRGKPKWNKYIEIIKSFHAVGTVVTSFSWEDYGYSDEFVAELWRDEHQYSPMTVIMLVYDIGSQKWYYTAQLNLIGTVYIDQNNNKELLDDTTRQYNGKVLQVLVSLLQDGGRPPALKCS